MKSNDRRKRWPLLVLVVASLLAVCWLLILPGTTGKQHTGRAVDQGVSPTDLKERIAVHSRAVENLEPGLERRGDLTLPAAMRKVLEDNPHLSQYYQLQQKVLPTRDERTMLRGMLSDPELIQIIKEGLLATEVMYSKEAEAKRMIEVEFLTDAVSWADNPAMEVVMETIESVIFADNISSEAEEDLARSLAGDKMELYTQMLHRAPALAETIAVHARGRNIEAFLSYSKDWYNQQLRAMKADEIQQ